MATQVQWRRGTAAEMASFIGALGEITVIVPDSPGEPAGLRVHDGITAGGWAVGIGDSGDYVTGVNIAVVHRLTQAQFDVIVDPDPMTIYFIVPESDGIPTWVGTGIWAPVGEAIV